MWFFVYIKISEKTVFVGKCQKMRLRNFSFLLDLFPIKLAVQILSKPLSWLPKWFSPYEVPAGHVKVDEFCHFPFLFGCSTSRH